MKRILGILLTFMMLVTLVPNVFAANQTTLNFDLTCDGEHEVTKETRDIITVTYVVKNATDENADYFISTMANRIYYDHHFFEYVEGSSKVTTGINQGTKLSIFTNANHYIYYNGFESPAEQYAANQVIGTFQLEIIATNGSSTIRSTSAQAADKDNKDYTVTTEDLVVKLDDTPVVPVYELSFETNGGTGIAALKEESSTVIELAGYTPRKDGFVFDGWHSDAALKNKVASVLLDGNKTVYAKWTEAKQQYTLSFNTNGGSSITSEKYNEGTVIDLTKTEYKPSKDGYSFDGWYADSSLKNKVTQITLNADTTVYAKWTKNSTGGDTGSGGGGATTSKYTITFETNGGSKIDSVYIDENKTIDLSNYITEKDGYKFTGWYSDIELKNKIVSVKVTKNVTIYAGWEKNETDTPAQPNTSYVPGMLNGKEHFAYIVGYDDGTVHPEANITRAEVATIVFRLLNEDVRKSNLTNTNSFNDVSSDDWYNTAVSTMAAMNVLKGYEGYFRPNDPITRAEFAAIAARLAEKSGNITALFTDISEHWAEPEIIKAASLGWVQGFDGYYRPDDAITRAEAMTIINRVLCRVPETVDDLHSDMKVWTDNMDTSKWYYINVQEATNSHTFKTKADGVHESWVALTENPDWADIEK